MPPALGFSDIHHKTRRHTTSIVRPLVGVKHDSIEASGDDNDSHTTFALQTSPFRTESMAAPAAPAGLLESSPSYVLETYTTCDSTPNLVSLSDVQVSSTQRARVQDLEIFYHRTSRVELGCRRWIRITLRMTVTRQSRYWKMNKVRAHTLVNRPQAYNLPNSLFKLLEEGLESQTSIDMDSLFSVVLDGMPRPGRHALVLTKYWWPPCQVVRCLQEITSWTYHMGCPRYLEQDVIHQPLNKGKPSNCFIAFLDSKWVMETRFGSDLERVHAELYVLQMMHCLQGKPGIASLIGVVLDRHGLVSAFLSELPANGRLCRAWIDAIDSSQSVAWHRREKWCKQVVKAVADIHKAGFVNGSCCTGPDLGLAIDADDNAVFYGRFQRDSLYDGMCAVSLPSEYWQTVLHGSLFAASPQTDIYQLGLILWGLASSRPGGAPTRSWLCKHAGCTALLSSVCTEPHADPIQLPPPSEDTPEYLKLIIAACRAENPDKRPAAWELMGMFPSAASTTGTVTGETPHGAKRHLTRPEECFEKFGQMFLCDICGLVPSPRRLHCEVCSMGNFDVCRRCFDSGAHCQDPQHLLTEYLYGTQVGKEYTSVKENGLRDVLIS